jgi:hypothetical protein
VPVTLADSETAWSHDYLSESDRLRPGRKVCLSLRRAGQRRRSESLSNWHAGDCCRSPEPLAVSRTITVTDATRARPAARRSRWPGVECINSHHVTRMILSFPGRTGTLSPSQ